jgi:cholesterol transport system auxiliary component
MKTLLPAALALALAAGCGALQTQSSDRPTLYSLAQAETAPSAVASALPRPGAPAGAPTLVVAPPHAAAGFDSRRMIYLRQADKPEYFAHNEWIDTPARMLAPLIVGAVERSGAFRAVVASPSPASGDIRLDTEILRLQQDFTSTPSRVRFTLRAYLVESATRRVIDTREFDAVVPAASEDPKGGVAAAGKAVRTVLGELSAFCAARARI